LPAEQRRIYADGTANELELRITGFGSFYGDELSTLEADVRISGAGSATLRVEEQLTAEISGAGSVGYYGSPEVDQHINGAGSVRQIGVPARSCTQRLPAMQADFVCPTTLFVIQVRSGITAARPL
jgi:hypothetical protein